MMLNKKLTEIKGIGEKKAQLFSKLGLNTVGDVLRNLPGSYRDYSELSHCGGLEEGERTAIVRIAASPSVRYIGSRSILTAPGCDETGRVNIIFYNQPYRKNAIRAGATYLVSGRVERGQRQMAFVNPEMEAIEEGAERGIMPVYPLTAGVTQRGMRGLAKSCLELMKDCELPETLDARLRRDYSLCELNFAIRNAHFPESMETAELARTRLLAESAMRYMLTIEYVAAQRKAVRGIRFDTEGLLESYLKLLPFEPTRAQLETMKQLERDMAAEHPMNRLVQGDVGSGKTAVAFFMLYAAVKNGRQGAVMAPTEVLARQHYGTAQSLMGDACGIALLTGSLKKAQKDEVKRGLADGSIDIVIGTHAVIQEGVEFAKLGAVVTDEQHRFGVRQRARLGKKGEAPDVLVLSATPIPRTLSLILYGDLDVSVISELPPGRKPVKTSIVPPHKRGDMYSYIRKTALEGGQAYIVCPLVEQSEQIDAVSAEQLYAELAGGVMSDVSVALLHGRMTGEQKDAVLSRFRKGEISVLVSTTVIEVGVDVANASIMAIEAAERFGLAQLHQLRGRVGRGKNQSYCFLLSQDEQAAKRLKLLCSTNDGFTVAQKDLELRGPGQFLGAEQSGGSDFLYSGLINDVRLLALAKAMAKRIMEDPEYADVKKAELARALRDAGQRLSDITLN